VARAAWDQLPFSLPVAHTTLLIAATGLQFLLILLGFVLRPSAVDVSIGYGFGAILGLIASLVAAGPVIYPAVRSYRESRNTTGGPQQY
jgi:hypothetical protein